MTHAPDERYAWLTLALTPNVGTSTFLRLIQTFGSALSALNAPFHEVKPHLSAKAQTTWRAKEAFTAAEAALFWEAQHENAHLLLLSDAHYPALLGEGMPPPPLLFVRGKLSLLHNTAVAIVGSRKPSPQGLIHAQRLAQELSSANVTVVSGMAHGIDTAAHEGALSAKGSTVTVWGTGIDRVYPPQKHSLAQHIAQKGCIVSEFPLGTGAHQSHFPRRNRIIAALAKITLVIEAPIKSGSLITANLAGEMGRDVMAVPGSIDNPYKSGCHHLIKQGAKLVDCVDDVLRELNLTRLPAGRVTPEVNAQAKVNADSVTSDVVVAPNIPTPTDVNQGYLQPRERVQVATNHTVQPASPVTPPIPKEPLQSLLDLMGYEPVHPDVLAEQSGLDTQDIHAAFVEWELDGRIVALAGGRFQRIGS